MPNRAVFDPRKIRFPLPRTGELEERQCKEFQRWVLGYAKRRGRSFPWRSNRTPYRVLVSEIMLQQTQANRVAGRYSAFLREFPSMRRLARAPVSQVVRAWQGLGYNRRALALHRIADYVTRLGNGRLPKNQADLILLPGIGEYTSRSIRVFAHGSPETLIETNIRSVFIYSFFRNKERIVDSDLIPIITRTVYKRDPARWYDALMDLGAELKQYDRSLTARSATYKKQSKFVGSRRQARGEILKLLADGSARRASEFIRSPILEGRSELVSELLSELVREGFLSKGRGKHWLTRTDLKDVR